MHWSGRVTVITALLLSAACATHQGPSSQTASLDKAKSKPLERADAKPVVVTRTQMADDVLLRAMAQIGTPYRWGGSSPQTGFDCSGLIGYVFNQSAGYRMPRSTTEMMQVKAPVIDRSRLRSGDIVFFATNGGRRVSHAGIYVGDNRFVHAPSSGGKVRIDSLDMPYWNKAYLQAKRYLPDERLASTF
ncbi:MAG: C40 family peptidase [Gammaproteobacteria bacterium]|nr:C40 family peptidase [Gammaproteobacteria bacterium]